MCPFSVNIKRPKHFPINYEGIRDPDCLWKYQVVATLGCLLPSYRKAISVIPIIFQGKSFYAHYRRHSMGHLRKLVTTVSGEQVPCCHRYPYIRVKNNLLQKPEWVWKYYMIGRFEVTWMTTNFSIPHSLSDLMNRTNYTQWGTRIGENTAILFRCSHNSYTLFWLTCGRLDQWESVSRWLGAQLWL